MMTLIAPVLPYVRERERERVFRFRNLALGVKQKSLGKRV